MERPSRPEMHQLLRVIPVAQSQTVGEGTVTVLSAELYDDAVRVTFRFQGLPHQERLSFPWEASVGREQGTFDMRHDGMTHAHGRRNPDESRTWWSDAIFTPTVPTDGHTLTLQLPRVQTGHVDKTGEKPVWIAEDLLVGPWCFVVAVQTTDA